MAIWWKWMLTPVLSVNYSYGFEIRRSVRECGTRARVDRQAPFHPAWGERGGLGGRARRPCPTVFQRQSAGGGAVVSGNRSEAVTRIRQQKGAFARDSSARHGRRTGGDYRRRDVLRVGGEASKTAGYQLWKKSRYR